MKTLTVDIVPCVESVSQVSAAPDGLVWVVCADRNIGSVVKWMDPKKGDWNLIPDLNNATRVTGGSKGKAYIINSAHEVSSYTKKGVPTTLKCDFEPSELSIGPDGRLWVLSKGLGESLGGKRAYYTDNNGKDWNEIVGAACTSMDAGVIDWQDPV